MKALMLPAQRHAPVERNRFTRHALATLAGWFGTARATGHSDASKVREMAYAYSKTDPGFAADLYAAAARHEGSGAD